MNFDLSKALGIAEETKNNQEDNSGNIKLVYPQEGTVKVKLLFNPASSLVSRKIARHSVEGTKIACLSQYGQDCPVCKIITSIQNAKGLDLWKLKATTRGISYAQFIDSDYTWSNPNDKPQQGEVVLLMYPWTVYQDINRIIAEAGSQAAQIVASNVGKILKISRWRDGNQIKYKAELDAFNNYQSCPSDAEYESLLTGLESLNSKIISETATEDMILKAKEVSNQLSGQYLSNNISGMGMSTPPGFNNMNTQQFGGQPQQGVFTPQGSQQQQPQFGGQPQFGQQGGFTPQSPQGSNPNQFGGGQPQGNNGFTPQQPQGNNGFTPQGAGIPQQQGGQATKPDNAPECYGKKNAGDINPNSCLLCPFELNCTSVSK